MAVVCPWLAQTFAAPMTAWAASSPVNGGRLLRTALAAQAYSGVAPRIVRMSPPEYRRSAVSAAEAEPHMARGIGRRHTVRRGESAAMEWRRTQPEARAAAIIHPAGHRPGLQDEP